MILWEIKVPGLHGVKGVIGVKGTLRYSLSFTVTKGVKNII